MPYSYERLPDLQLPARDGCNLFVMDSGTGPKLHIANGWSLSDPDNFPTSTTNDLWRIEDPETGVCTKLLTQQRYTPRHTGGHAVDSLGRAHNFGADIQLGEYDQRHWISRVLGGNVINRLQSDGQIGRRVFALSGRLGDQVLFAGGQEFPSTLGPETSGMIYTDVIAFDVTNPDAGWVTLEIECRALPRTTTSRIPELDGNAYFYGGNPEHTAPAIDTIYRSTGLDFSALGMVLLATDSRLARLYSANVAWDGRLWQLFGTVQGLNSSGIYHFAPDGTDIQEFEHDMPASHAGDACVGVDGHLYYACGSSNVGPEGTMIVCNRLYRIRVTSASFDSDEITFDSADYTMDQGVK